MQRQVRNSDTPFVFASDTPGRPIQSMQNVWQRVRAQAGLTDVRLHDLRHSFASMAAAQRRILYSGTDRTEFRADI